VNGVPERPLVIGIGNENRRDDRCGLDVVRSLRDRGPTPARIVEGGDDATTLLDLWDGVARVVVVDAMRSGRPPGTVHRFEVDPESPPGALPVTSTHGLSLNEAIGLGRALGRLPRSLVVYGIEVGDVSPGSGLTPPVAVGVPRAVDQIAEELARPGGPGRA
jgi:hydrogenase maturation protease